MLNENSYIKLDRGQTFASTIFGPSGAVAYALLNDNIEVLCRNGMTKETKVMYLPIDCLDGLIKWVTTYTPIQDALPTLSASKREMLMTGMSDEEFYNDPE